MRIRFIGTFILTCFAAAACAKEDGGQSAPEDLGDAFDVLVEAAPTVCKSYCAKRADCMFDALEEQQPEAAKTQERFCAVDCAWYLENGAYVMSGYEDGDDWEEDYIGQVSGENLSRAFECLWAADVFECSEDWFVMIDMDSEEGFTEDDCSTVAECYALLEYEGLSEYEWISEDGWSFCELAEDADAESSSELSLEFPYM